LERTCEKTEHSSVQLADCRNSLDPLIEKPLDLLKAVFELGELSES